MPTLACWSRAVVFSLAAFSAVPALAQETVPAPTPAPAQQEVPVSDKAREHFRTGVAYMQDPDGARYEEAYREFKAAYADSPSWKILGNLGITAMKLERDGEAVWAFEKYLQEGRDQVDPAERAQMERDLTTTKASLVWITIQSDPPGALFVDERVPLSGRPIENRYEASDEPVRMGIRRGRHRITTKLSGYQDSVWEFEAVPGEEQSHVFKLEKPASATQTSGPQTVGPVTAVAPERPIPLPVYITAGATGLLLAGAGVTGILAMGKKSEFEDANDGTDRRNAQDLKDGGETLNLVADILLAGGVVAGAVTAVLFITRPEVTPEQDTAALRISPVVGPTGGALSLTGAF